MNLMMRDLPVNVVCPGCGNADESTDHLFRYCPVSKDVWSELHLAEKIHNTDLSFDQWLIWAFNALSEPQCKILCCALWMIWRNRNICVHEKRLISGKESAISTLSYIGEIDALECRNILNPVPMVKWVAPVGNVIKINFVVAFDKHGNRWCGGQKQCGEDAQGPYCHS